MPMIAIEVNATDEELKKYGEEGMKELWWNILERYAHEEWFDPDLASEFRKPATGLDGWLLKTPDARTDKQQADKKSMEFGRRMGAKEYN